jgi:hypothetical protein
MLTRSTPSYDQQKQRLISQYHGIQDGIFLLENAIKHRPTSPREISEIEGYKYYCKVAFVRPYTFTFDRKKLEIYYLYNHNTDDLLLVKIEWLD